MKHASDPHLTMCWMKVITVFALIIELNQQIKDFREEYSYVVCTIQ